MSSVAWLPHERPRRQIAWALEEVPHEGNRRKLEEYLKERFVNGMDPKTLKNDVHAVRDLAVDLDDKPFLDATKDDILEHFANPYRTRKWRSKRKDGTFTVNEREVELKASTLAVRKDIVRCFFKWLYDAEEYPEPVRKLNPKRGNRNKIPVDELINRDDLKALLTAQDHPRDKALVAVMFESGMRAGEIVALDIRNAEFDEYGARILLPTDATGLKTGARRIRLIDSAPYLHRWYEDHPGKEDPHAPLFPSISTKNRGARLTTSALWYFTKRAGERAGLKKHLHPHLFRHSSATEKARMGWNEAQMRAYFGWSRTSTQPAEYNHLAGLDYEDMMLEKAGKKKPGDTYIRALAPKVCPACQTENDANAKYCSACATPISPDAYREREELRKEDLKEEAAKLIAEGMKEEIAQAVQRALENRTHANG